MRNNIDNIIAKNIRGIVNEAFHFDSNSREENAQRAKETFQEMKTEYYSLLSKTKEKFGVYTQYALPACVKFVGNESFRIPTLATKIAIMEAFVNNQEVQDYTFADQSVEYCTEKVILLRQKYKQPCSDKQAFAVQRIMFEGLAFDISKGVISHSLTSYQASEIISRQQNEDVLVFYRNFLTAKKEHFMRKNNM